MTQHIVTSSAPTPYQKSVYGAYIFLAFVVVCAPFWMLQGLGYKLFINQSHSIHGFVFLGKSFERSLSQDALRPGDLIAFHHKSFKSLVIKRIAGCPGDAIESVINDGGRSLFVSGKMYVRSKTTHENLTTIEAIPHHHYFVAGDHPKSFDSRYAAFGLVANNDITHRVGWVLLIYEKSPV